MIVAALAGKQVPHSYLLFPGEQHGFRRAENIIRAFESELSFYGQVFGFEPAGLSEPVRIRHARTFLSARRVEVTVAAVERLLPPQPSRRLGQWQTQ